MPKTVYFVVVFFYLFFLGDSFVIDFKSMPVIAAVRDAMGMNEALKSKALVIFDLNPNIFILSEQKDMEKVSFGAKKNE